LDAVIPHKDEDFDSEGWQRFLAPNTEAVIRNRLNGSDYITLLCENHEELVGLITIKNHEIIDQFFVHPLFRRKGVALGLALDIALSDALDLTGMVCSLYGLRVAGFHSKMAKKSQLRSRRERG